MTVGQRIRHSRRRRGWTQLMMITRMERVAQGHTATAATGHAGTAATRDSLRSQLSKWEHDRLIPNQYNRRLIAETLGVTVADLGLDEDPYFNW